MLAERINRPLHVSWRPSRDLGAEYDDLFASSPAFQVNSPDANRHLRLFESSRLPMKALRKTLAAVGYSTELRDIKDPYFYTDFGGELMEEPFEKLSRKSLIYIRSIHSFLYGRQIDYLKPHSDIMAAIDGIASGFTQKTVGIQIRRGDHAKAIAQSPLVLFERYMQQALDQDPEVNFYLSTDCFDTIEKLSQMFGDRILRNEDVVLDRNSVAGLKSAVVDVWSLSKTQKIVGAAFSSFGEYAARLGDIPLERLQSTN